MIVRQFLQWVRTAPAGDRAQAAGLLARSFLHAEIPAEDREDVLGMLVMLTEDGCADVRRALAEALAASREAPSVVIHALARDAVDIAAVVLEHSPLFIDAELIDLAATGCDVVQAAIARRSLLPCTVAAAIAEVGSAEACLVMIENPKAVIAPLSFGRLAERFGDLAAVREAMLAHPALPIGVRQSLVARLSVQLASYVAARSWIAPIRAETLTQDICERAIVSIAADAPDSDIAPLVRHLRETGQLTAGLILRALLSGHVGLFEEALAELSGLPLRRIRLLLHDRSGVGLRAIFTRAELPRSSYPAFRHALAVRQEDHDIEVTGRLDRHMVERVLSACERTEAVDIAPLVARLRRFAAEAARDEAALVRARLDREFADDVGDVSDAPAIDEAIVDAAPDAPAFVFEMPSDDQAVHAVDLGPIAIDDPYDDFAFEAANEDLPALDADATVEDAAEAPFDHDAMWAQLERDLRLGIDRTRLAA